MARAPAPSETLISPAAFGDPVALVTGWGPAHKGGSNFTTHRLVERGTGRVEFRPTAGMVLFAGLFIALGAGMTMFFGGAFVEAGPDARVQPESWVPVIAGLLFLGAGVWFMRWALRPRVFDRSLGVYWQGRRPTGAAAAGGGNKSCPLAEIHAVQLLRERVRGNRGSYWSYELNLVLRDGHRIPVVDHSNHGRLREEGARLARWLGRPIWDAAA